MKSVTTVGARVRVLRCDDGQAFDASGKTGVVRVVMPPLGRIAVELDAGQGVGGTCYPRIQDVEIDACCAADDVLTRGVEKQRVIEGLRDVDAIVRMPDGGWIRSCNVAAVVVCETSSEFQTVEVHMLGGTKILMDFARPGAWRVERDS